MAAEHRFSHHGKLVVRYTFRVQNLQMNTHTPAGVAIVLALMLVGCGESRSPTAPTPPQPVTTPGPPPVGALEGRWSGRMEVKFQDLFEGRRVFVDTELSIRHDRNLVAGNWVVTAGGNDIGGAISGTVDGGMFHGSVTWDSSAQRSAVRCRGSAIFTGPATADELRWTSPGWNFGQTCADPPSDVVWTSQPNPRTIR